MYSSCRVGSTWGAKPSIGHRQIWPSYLSYAKKGFHKSHENMFLLMESNGSDVVLWCFIQFCLPPSYGMTSPGWPSSTKAKALEARGFNCDWNLWDFPRCSAHHKHVGALIWLIWSHHISSKMFFAIFFAIPMPCLWLVADFFWMNPPRIIKNWPEMAKSCWGTWALMARSVARLSFKQAPSASWRRGGDKQCKCVCIYIYTHM